jgi:hypothetical protein
MDRGVNQASASLKDNLMANDIKEMRRKLQSDDVDEVHDVLIDIGKEGLHSLVEDVARLLHHPEGAARGAAIRVLAFYWKLDDYRAVAENMMRDDPDSGVRAIALMAWAGYSAGTRDYQVMRRLYAILRDPEEDQEVRANAYPNLLAVGACPKSEWPNDDVYGNIDAGVDWALLDRMMEEAAPMPR